MVPCDTVRNLPLVYKYNIDYKKQFIVLRDTYHTLIIKHMVVILSVLLNNKL